MELFGATEYAVRFTELRERGRGRLNLERRTRDQRRRGIFPSAFEDTLHEVVHDERRFAEEAALPCGLLNAEDDFIPLALLQRAHRDLVTEDLLAGALVGRSERTACADLHAVDESLVCAFEIAEM